MFTVAPLPCFLKVAGYCNCAIWLPTSRWSLQISCHFNWSAGIRDQLPLRKWLLCKLDSMALHHAPPSILPPPNLEYSLTQRWQSYISCITMITDPRKLWVKKPKIESSFIVFFQFACFKEKMIFLITNCSKGRTQPEDVCRSTYIANLVHAYWSSCLQWKFCQGLAFPMQSCSYFTSAELQIALLFQNILMKQCKINFRIRIKIYFNRQGYMCMWGYLPTTNKSDLTFKMLAEFWKWTARKKKKSVKFKH